MAAKHRGLRWERTADAIRSFVTLHGRTTPRRAVLCTFDLEPDRFDAVLAPELIRRGRQFRTLIMADAGALQSNLRHTRQGSIGRYQIAPVLVRGAGVFHPKLVFMAAGRRCLMGVGSANLTPGGLGGNLELMLFADNTTADGARLVGAAAHFLDRLCASRAILMPASARQFVDIALSGVRRDKEIMLDSITTPLLSQMRNAHRSNFSTASAISVISPWHSGAESTDGVDPAILGRLRQSFQNKRISVFTNGRKGGLAPALGRAADVFIRGETSAAEPLDGDAEALLERRPRRVHAKAYLVESGAQGATFFFGSANCTLPALARPAERQGNVELLVPSKLDAGDIRQFRNDLSDLFQKAQRTFAMKAAPPPSRPAGLVLAGTLTRAGTKPRLRIEVSQPNCQVHISSDAEPGHTVVRVVAKRGAGYVEDARQLDLLFKGSLPERGGNSWSTVLWERARGGFCPFPVSIPLIGEAGGTADEELQDLVWDELGVWPPKVSDGSNHGDADDEQERSDEDEDDLQALAEAKHQGELDRIAVAASILRRRICSSAAGSAYAIARIESLCKQIQNLGLASHLREAVLAYLQASRKAQ